MRLLRYAPLRSSLVEAPAGNRPVAQDRCEMTAFTIQASKNGQTITTVRMCGKGWNRVAHLRSHEGIVSGGKVNWLIDGFCGERLPTIDLAHVDLPGCK